MVPSQPVVALALAIFLFFVTIPIARKVAKAESDPSLHRLLMWAVGIHLLFAPLQIWVVDHVYHGISDYNRYVNQGAILARNFDHFNFSMAGTNVKPIGAGAVSIVAGIVFGVIGVDKLAGFFAFGWFAFIGSVCFFRAYSVTFPEAPHKRYAKMIFFLPSLLFWTAGISKETVLYVSLGIAAYGAARIMASRPAGGVLMVLGTAIGVWVRPQDFLLFLAVVVVATLFRPRNPQRALSGIRRIAVMTLQIALVGLAAVVAQHLAKSGSPVFNLSTVSQNNAGQGSTVAYSSSPAAFPKDVYTVLFDPLPINAHGNGQRVAAFENTVIIVLILTSLRRLRRLPRAAIARPYVMASVIFALASCYAYAALGNLGLIDRERVLLLPFLLVPLAIPISPKGRPPQFPWELTLRQRRRRRGRQGRWSARASVGG